MMHPQAFFNDVRYRHAWRQRAVWILEYDLHVVAEGPHLLELESFNGMAHEYNRPRGGDQPKDGKPKRGFARTRFTDDAQRLAFSQLDTDTIDRFDVTDNLAHHAALDRKPHFEVFRFDNDWRIRPWQRRIRLWLGSQQRSRVRMFGRSENALDFALLNDFSALHHANSIGKLAYDAKVMSDEHHRHAELGLDVLQQFQDLRLDGHVERGRGLVGYQKVRLVGEGHGDHHALALATGELVRIAAKAAGRIGDSHLPEQFDNLGARGVSIKPLMQRQNFTNLLFDRVQGIERGHRLLKDDCDVVAAHLPNFLFRHRQQFAALKFDGARRMVRRRIGQQLHNRQRGNRLARA